MGDGAGVGKQVSQNTKRDLPVIETPFYAHSWQEKAARRAEDEEAKPNGSKT